MLRWVVNISHSGSMLLCHDVLVLTCLSGPGCRANCISDVRPLEGLSCLRELRQTAITASALPSLAMLPALRVLALAATRAARLPPVIASLPYLEASGDDGWYWVGCSTCSGLVLGGMATGGHRLKHTC